MIGHKASPELIAHIARLSGLPAHKAERIICEVADAFSETPEQYMTRRHAELQGMGRRNADIFRILRNEIGRHRFSAPEFSERQIRRLLYG